MSKNKSFLKSFEYAFCGIVTPFGEERNLRVHFSIANLIIIFAYFFGITRIEWAILFLTIGFVIACELINTAVENAVDTASTKISKTAKLAKDTAAGAVLFAAITAVITGFCLFFDTEKIVNTLTYIFTTPKVLIPCLLVGIFDVLFIISGGKKH